MGMEEKTEGSKGHLVSLIQPLRCNSTNPSVVAEGRHSGSLAREVRRVIVIRAGFVRAGIFIVANAVAVCVVNAACTAEFIGDKCRESGTHAAIGVGRGDVVIPRSNAVQKRGHHERVVG